MTRPTKLSFINKCRLRVKLYQLNKIATINKGGCTISATLLYLYLRDTLNVQSNIVHGQELDSCSCIHAFIQLKNGVCFDSNGFSTLEALVVKYELPTVANIPYGDTVVYISTELHNRNFKRAIEVPKIIKILATDLNHRNSVYSVGQWFCKNPNWL